MAEYIFTFGFAHTDPATGESRAKKFTRIQADTYEAARDRMNATYGRQWAFQYESEDEAGVERHGLSEVTESVVPDDLAALLAEVYKPEGIRIWWGGANGSLGWQRPVDVWREEPAKVLKAAEALLGQVAT